MTYARMREFEAFLNKNCRTARKGSKWEVCGTRVD